MHKTAKNGRAAADGAATLQELEDSNQLTTDQKRFAAAIRTAYGLTTTLKPDAYSSDPAQIKTWHVERIVPVNLANGASHPAIDLPVDMDIGNVRDEVILADLKTHRQNTDFEAWKRAEGNFERFRDYWLPRIRPPATDPSFDPLPTVLLPERTARRGREMMEAHMARGFLAVIPVWGLIVDPEKMAVTDATVDKILIWPPKRMDGKPVRDLSRNSEWPPGEYGYQALYSRDGDYGDYRITKKQPAL